MLIDFFVNPYAKLPLPDPIERLLEKGGITISTWQDEAIALLEEVTGK